MKKLLIVFAVLVFAQCKSENNKTKVISPQNEVSVEPDLNIVVEEIVSIYNSNSGDGDRNFKDRDISVKGVVMESNETDLKNGIVRLMGENSKELIVKCKMKFSNNLKDWFDHRAEIKGRCLGIVDGYVYMENCEFMQ